MVLLLFTTLFVGAAPAPAPAPDLTGALSALLGVPYVNDAALDADGRWTFIAHPEKTADGPGLNCSGFVLAAAQRLFHRPTSFEAAARDRLGDSGDDAPFGKDWDYGFDLVMNVSDGLAREGLLPQGPFDLADQTGAVRGFATDNPAEWKRILPQIQRGRVYLLSLNRRLGKKLQHHHVAVVLKDLAGRVWFYQTLPKGRSHRLELTTQQGLERLAQMFRGTQVLVVAVQPPELPDAGG